jgi:hypothetical protein
MDLSITVNGIKFPNPFLLGSGPPGTNARVLAKAYDAGWGGAVAKTVSLESSKVVNVVPRYGKLRSRENNEVIGFQNIELISDRPIEVWLGRIQAGEERVSAPRADCLDYGGVQQGPLAGTYESRPGHRRRRV